MIASHSDIKRSPGRPRIGLALGSGSARGWSHIGVINALADLGIEPEIISGCSIGSVVGASYAAGNLDKLQQWVLSLTKLDVARLFELDFSLSGFVDTELLQSFLHDYVAQAQLQIGDLAKTFATVSTDLQTGREVWFTDGLVNDAVWASISLPGIFPPVRHQGRWLVDGGLVNPVPVSVCRALGADVVIAVNLNGDIVGKHFYAPPKQVVETQAVEQGLAANLSKTFKTYSSALFSSKENGSKPPGIFEALASSVNITQDRITRSRMAGDPPDITLSPRLSDIALLEFYRADQAIREGEACVYRLQSQLQAVLQG